MVKQLRCATRAVVLLTLASGCGGDDVKVQTEDDTTAMDGSGASSDTLTSSSSSSTSTTAGPDGTSSGTSSANDSTTSDDDTTGMRSECDYEVVDGMIVIEAENLPIHENWEVQDTHSGFYADGYIAWNGGSHFNDPTHGVMQVTVHVADPGRYRLRWRNRIGMGADATEHNDTWVRFPDAADFHGLQMSGSGELRRYPRPRCEDADAMAAIEALPQVEAVACVQGSSTDDWLKVYSSGATDWSWSCRTNDHDPFDVMVEFDAPGDYTFMMAARSDWHLIDRIVIHEEGLDDAIWQDPQAAETVCRR
jgi:hypothetical protein